MNYFKKYNTIAGWAAFLVAAVVYLMTIEPSASLWDCSEFIATSYKLEVGHPPGAPLFMMIARLFAIFAPGTENVAMMINAMSAIASAFTILFLFWTITHFARRLAARRGEELTTVQTWTIIGAGLVGSLAYAFTDTFWFSAVEAEVYALSSLFTAIVVWAVLKWEEEADKPHANRWLILIAYLMGLSIGVHILNLLAIPAIVFVYYFKKTPKVTFKGVVKVSIVAALILLFINNIIIPYTAATGALFDRMFVNSFGLPVNTGLVVFAVLLFAALGFAVYITHRKRMVVWNIIALCVTVIMIGYGSYASVVIRAAANPPMNSNNPDNGYDLLYLLNREQYGNYPILYGPQYSAPIEDAEYNTKYYVGEDGKYHAARTFSGKYKYPSEFMTLFPRMWADGNDYVEGYKQWGQVQDKKAISYMGERYTVPTSGENFRYFFSYQVNFMYWRYFLWNFVGRQSDVQSFGGITDGQWMSGVNFIDEAYLGPQDNLPDEMAHNKGRNHYYFLPFILGIIGLIYQLNRDPKNFTVVMWLFFMMGLALVIYFNTRPNEVRERDYVFAGSFYAFSIWIGLGVMCIKGWIQRLMKKESLVAAVIATVVCAGVPVLLCAQNWDDHDRSHRYVARDMGWNYLQSCLPNSILMNYGDNDTFPIWYEQEVEEVRLDVRPMNMSYLLGGWYIDEMKYKSNESDAVPFSLPSSKYTYTNEYVPVEELFDMPITARQAINFVKDDDPRSRLEYGGVAMDYIPAKTILLPVNKQNAIDSGIVKPEDAHLMADTIVMNIKRDVLERSELMLLDLLANFDWKRPLYVTQPSSLSNLGLEDWLQFDGYAYRIVPIHTPASDSWVSGRGRIDTDYLYHNLMEVFRFGNVSDPRVYIDSFIDYNYNASQIFMAFARLASALTAEGDTERAVDVLDYAMKQLPVSKFRWSIHKLPIIQAYYDAGADEKGDLLLEEYFNTMCQYIEHYLSFPDGKRDLVAYDLEERVSVMNELLSIAEDSGRTVLSDSMAMQGLEYGLETYRKNNYMFPYFYPYVTYIAAYYEDGDTEKGDQMLDAYTSIFMSELSYLNSMRDAEPEIAERYIRENTIIMGELLRIAEYHDRPETASKIKAFFGIE